MGIEQQLKAKNINPEKDFKLTREQTEAAEDSMTRAIALQKQLGLGNSEVAGERLLSGCKAAKAVKQLLAAGYNFVEEPDQDSFPRFTGTTEQARCNRSFGLVAPQYAMVQLSATVKELLATGDSRNEWKADIPIMPTTVLERAGRVTESAPNAQFHLIFEPEWKKQPQKDPVLLARIAEGFWCEVGHWGSDADAIHMMLKEKNLA